MKYLFELLTYDIDYYFSLYKNKKYKCEIKIVS